MTRVAEKVTHEVTEAESVADWRLHTLIGVGVGVDIAEKLGKTDADLHVMVGAKLAGASDELLLRIFG